ncbi:MAG TPA: mechanosensitive ion channel domain-containing protein [Chloroflexota bacterium]|nr:mechanosensitive ion channel domain-containing protein [Chloroflexota bacterium]
MCTARGMRLFGVQLVGLNGATGQKLLLTLALFAAVWLLSAAGRWTIRALRTRESGSQLVFWGQQGFSLAAVALFVLGIISIWFNSAGQLATVGGIASAGIAFALQKPITAVAGYFVVLRSRVFTVGDRITLGGVRGDVISLSLLQTTVMEMGEPPGVQEQALPPTWVHGRQYTGRVVAITNDKVFDNPVYNYTREFPFLWDEMRIPIRYDANRQTAERILLEVAELHSTPIHEISQRSLDALKQRYGIEPSDITPRVYYRLTDNWLELTLRFRVDPRGARPVKDLMSRDILTRFDAAGIGIASATYDIVHMPPLRVVTEPPADGHEPPK